MRLPISIIIFLLPGLQLQPVNAQSVNDTIIIQDVIVKGRTVSGNSGFKQNVIDSVILEDYTHKSLSDVLSENSPVFIKSYGLGGLSTTSFRGTGASQTQVMWNGISISSPMLGQSDLSLIPAGMVDDIRFYYGGASLAVNSGGMGGIINVETATNWKNETSLTVNPGTGSFGNYNGLVKYKAGTENFQSVTKGFINSSENNYKYLNSVFSADPVEEKRKNAQIFQNGLMQEFYLKNSNSSTSAQFWYNSSERNLPSPIVIQQSGSGEKQSDFFFRSLLRHKIYSDKINYDFSLSWFADKLNYSNLLASINSKNSSHTFSAKTEIATRSIKNTTLKGSLSEEYILIRSNNYEGNKDRNLISLSASAEHLFGKSTGVVFLMRQTIVDNKILIPDFSLGFDFKPVNNHDFYVKGNISKNSRIPTMNDMYWNPGGNPDLKNEYSFTYEVTFEMNEELTAGSKIKTEVTLFDNNIHEMIQWQPGGSSYWTPVNIGHVETSGIEASMELAYKLGAFSFISRTGYAMTIAESLNTTEQAFENGRKQLVYVPENMINTGLKVYYRNFYSSWSLNYTGKRFITTDNSKYLPGYSVNDILVGLKIPLPKNSLEINARIENVMGVSYQNVSYYPMPGRSVFVSVLYKFIK